MASLTQLQPDLVVVSNDQIDILLAVEVKAGEPWDLERAEKRLAEYMVKVGCPVGLLLTPKHILLYRNAYSGLELKRIGDFQYQPIPAGWEGALVSGPAGQERGFLFERAVQNWLESLVQPSERSALPPDLGEAFEQFVVPALLQGELRVTSRRARMIAGS